MANVRIKDITTTASAPAADDYLAIDGSTAGTRKILAKDLQTETDTTLSVSGKAADAKVTGDEISGLKTDLVNSFYPNEIAFKNIAQTSWYASGVVYYPMPTLNAAHSIKFSGGMELEGTASGSFFELWYSNNTTGGITNVFNPGVSKTVLNTDTFTVEGTITPTTGRYLAVFLRAQKTAQTAGAGIKYTNPVMIIDGVEIKPLNAAKFTSNNSYDLSFNFVGVGITRTEFKKALDNGSVVSDSLGNTYKLFVQDGTIKHHKAVYKKVLCFGNSIAKHPVSSSLGWYVERGMASTTDDTDYVHLLKTGLKAKDSSAVVDSVYAITWEQNFSTDLNTLLGAYVSNDYDLIIIQIGENVPSGSVSGLESALNTLINELHILFPGADFMVTNMFINSTDKNKALRLSSIDKSAIWQDTNYPTPFFNKIAGNGAFCDNNGTLFPLVNAEVWTHPSDLYMLYKANGILTALGYDPLDLERTITVSGSVSNLCHSKSVVGSLVTCIIYTETTPTVSITANGQNVPYEIKSYADVTWLSTPDPVPTYGIVFTMPSNNVTIALS